MRNSATMFATPKERTSKSGEKYNRLEAYGKTADLKQLVDNAIASGDTMVQVLPRVYEKDKENRIAIEFRFFKGKTESK